MVLTPQSSVLACSISAASRVSLRRLWSNTVSVLRDLLKEHGSDFNGGENKKSVLKERGSDFNGGENKQSGPSFGASHDVFCITKLCFESPKSAFLHHQKPPTSIYEVK